MNRMHRLADWLDLNDYGYPLGLLTYITSGVTALLGWWQPAIPVMIIAFALCWWFG